MRKWFTYTIYPAHHDPAPGRGHKPAQVGITFQPAPSLTRNELLLLIAHLQRVAEEMHDA